MPDIHVGQDGVIKIAVTGSSAGTERTIIYRLGANGTETGRTDIDSGLTTGTFRGNKTFSPDGHFVMLGSTPGDPFEVWLKIISPDGSLKWESPITPEDLPSILRIEPLVGGEALMIQRTFQGGAIGITVHKFNNLGSIAWAKDVIIPEHSILGIIRAVRTDTHGNIYICGPSTSRVPVDGKIFGNSYSLAKLDPMGELIWYRWFMPGDKHWAYPCDVLPDGSGGAYITGTGGTSRLDSKETFYGRILDSEDCHSWLPLQIQESSSAAQEQ